MAEPSSATAGPWRHWRDALYLAVAALAFGNDLPPETTPTWRRLLLAVTAGMVVVGVLLRHRRPALLAAAGGLGIAGGVQTIAALGLFSYAARARGWLRPGAGPPASCSPS